MIIVDRVYSESDLPEAARGYARDTVTLGWEERTHVHGRRRTDGGVEFGTSLPRGTVLRAGDCLVLDESRIVAAILERAEPVFVIEPRSPQEWGAFAYHIGNRHQPLMITPTAIVCPDAPAMDQLLQQHHIPHRRAMMAFTPVAGFVGHQH
jgi:urease accessory protein